MSDYAGVTPIPDYLNISDWYELVDGDTIPNGWSAIVLYLEGDVKIIRESYGYQQIRQVRSALKNGHRFFTRTPPPSAIKRIRANKTQQDELPQQQSSAASDWEAGVEQTLRQLRNELHDTNTAHKADLKELEDKIDKLTDTLNNYIDGA